MKSDEPRALHRTASIFLRNLAPTITKQEVEAMCKRYSGFLRAAIADPQPDRRWFRRGWVTFERGVKSRKSASI
ncbi:Serrate RNA effector molecule -like protein [Caligus rogercresseyi]|uniref:Serrate RNA effector molecule -like protein n=1 Tax=Caligus rogercresseyi TaxID=217165 RepID=A0A7T8GW51_CALRO|nr:Serrate RNA effector molecule -like protein [Caligus rogercresseyi]